MVLGIHVTTLEGKFGKKFVGSKAVKILDQKIFFVELIRAVLGFSYAGGKKVPGLAETLDRS